MLSGAPLNEYNHTRDQALVPKAPYRRPLEHWNYFMIICILRLSLLVETTQPGILTAT